jgi:nucleoside-diphosphate-sugar epimerase
MAFQGIMSGQSEANQQLGYNVNIESHKNLLEAAKKVQESTGKKITFVHISGLAVFGGDMCKPEAFVDPMVSAEVVSDWHEGRFEGK